MRDGHGTLVPLFRTMNRLPGGLMLIPLLLGSVIGTFAPGALEIGGFTTALFKDSALPLIALLIFATGTQVTMRTGGPVLATTGVVLLAKSVIPGLLVIALGAVTGADGVLGVSILALLAAATNSNGGLWLAVTGQYGRARDRGAYIAGAINDGPFFALLFLGASGLGEIPFLALLAAVLPFVLGVIVGNVDAKWREVLTPVPNIVIPFFSFSLGTGINLADVAAGGLSGILLGVLLTVVTGGLVYLGYRVLLRRGAESGIGFAAGTTSGNSVATPAIVAAADPSFQQYVGTATSQIAACVLVTAILAPLLATWLLKRSGAADTLAKESAAEQEAAA
ncbi:2-keto-3-deoxygluconate permease [Streptomonospora nanhaiensis]|uniref:2-keto-3-deoxygluconate permease n=1 Tax=Streptomonospora nanhaiensis TaxID=1323731 RepID=A0A853BR34_9ACTN|nr:2-keto-3-deoxygluconate permease [Streptomonospora nanhaiensis]MBV2366964.1 2-keto-3-deoxygluconate permease [Streptomonospora nanhaiensis]MBX9389402.1 2-keto-3-deoxygluconate permease [Streptomonospora nanhaiensis]NYI96951.1 2-keto-3-deoxygluconate permease [Streptomonospora nanhaiensis]